MLPIKNRLTISNESPNHWGFIGQFLSHLTSNYMVSRFIETLPQCCWVNLRMPCWRRWCDIRVLFFPDFSAIFCIFNVTVANYKTQYFFHKSRTVVTKAYHWFKCLFHISVAWRISIRFFLVLSFIDDDPCPVNRFSQDRIFKFSINNQVYLSFEYFFKLLF